MRWVGPGIWVQGLGCARPEIWVQGRRWVFGFRAVGAVRLGHGGGSGLGLGVQGVRQAGARVWRGGLGEDADVRARGWGPDSWWPLQDCHRHAAVTYRQLLLAVSPHVALPAICMVRYQPHACSLGNVCSWSVCSQRWGQMTRRPMPGRGLLAAIRTVRAPSLPAAVAAIRQGA